MSVTGQYVILLTVRLPDHVCNLKEFKIYGGMDTENMVEILHHGKH